MQYDYFTGGSRADTNRGTENNYKVGRFEDIVAMAKDPGPSRDKDSHWAIFLRHNGPDARSTIALRKSESTVTNSCIWVDIDRGDPTWDQVYGFASYVAAGCEFLVYTSRSHGEVRTEDDVCPTTGHVDKAGTVKRKYRIIFPHITELPWYAYEAFASALVSLAYEHGLILDPVATRPTQLCYLPNQGPEYFYYHAQGDGRIWLSPDSNDHDWWYNSAMASYQAKEAQRLSVVAKEETSRSPVAAFCRKHSAAEMLQTFGFETYDGENWHHPSQSTRSFGTKVDDDGRGWVTASGSVEDMLGGKKNGDAYDVYIHLQCGGNYDAGLTYARECLAEEDAKRFGCATAEHGQALWDGHLVHGLKMAQEKNAAMVKEIELDDDDGNSHEWNLGWPPGLVGELAQWIYSSTSRPIKQFAICMALFVVAGSARRYTIKGTGLNFYYMLVAKTGRGKGVNQDAVDRLMYHVANDAQDPNLVRCFNYETAVSDAGFRTALAEQNPLCIYEPELGTSLKAITKENASPNDIKLRSMLARLFDSGIHSFLGTKAASKAEDVKRSIEAPTVTLGGDSQFKPFRELIGASSMGDIGFPSRMIPFFYSGKRLYHNEDSDNHQIPSRGLVDQVIGLRRFAMSSGPRIPVTYTTEAAAMSKGFDKHYTDIINNSPDSFAEMYNRADTIIGRLAGLIAVGVDGVTPVINEEVLGYAKAVVDQGLKQQEKILGGGGAGSGESVRVYHLRKALERYTKMPSAKKVGTYRLPAKIDSLNAGIINEHYLIKSLVHLSDFKAGSYGTSEKNVRECIAEALRQQIIEEFTPIELDGRNKQKFYIIGELF